MGLDTNLLNSITQMDARHNQEEIARSRAQARQIGSVLGNIPGYAKQKRISNYWMQKDMSMDPTFETDSYGDVQFGDNAINFKVGSLSDEWEGYKNNVSGFMGSVGTGDYQQFQQLYNAKYADYANKIGFKLQSMENRGISKKKIKRLINSSPQFKESLIRLDSMSPESGISNYIGQEGFFPTMFGGIKGDSMLDPTAMKLKAGFEGAKGWRAGLRGKELAKNMFGPSAETRSVAKKAWTGAKNLVKDVKGYKKAQKVAKTIPSSGVSKMGGKWRVTPGDTGKAGTQTKINFNTKGTQTKASKGAMSTIKTFIKKNGLKKTMKVIGKKLGWKGAAKLFGKGVASVGGKIASVGTFGASGIASMALDAATAIQIAKILKDSVSEMKSDKQVSNLKF